jgi:hypothetical protein
MEQESRRPTISKETTEMALKSRQKLMGTNNNKEVSLIDIFLVPIKRSDEEWRKRELEKLSNKEVEGCTFTPETINYRTDRVV